MLVTKRSSPTSWTLPPSLSVSSFQPFQSFSPQPSSMETMGYLAGQAGVPVDEPLGVEGLALPLQHVLAGLRVVELGEGAVERQADLLARLEAGRP